MLLKEIKRFNIFRKILFLFYRFKLFAKIYGFKTLHFFISQDFQIIINLWNIQNYVYDKNKVFVRLKLFIAMMKNHDQSVGINHNPTWSYIPDHSYRILIICCSGSGKTNVLLNLKKHQWPDIDKIYLYVKNKFESKYHLLINGRQKVELKYWNNQKDKLIIHKKMMKFMKI